MAEKASQWNLRWILGSVFTLLLVCLTIISSGYAGAQTNYNSKIHEHDEKIGVISERVTRNETNIENMAEVMTSMSKNVNAIYEHLLKRPPQS